MRDSNNYWRGHSPKDRESPGVALLVRWSRLRGWGAAHVLAVAGGALLTYVWVGFAQSQALGIPLGVAVLGNAVFGVGAIILLATAVRALKRRQA